MLGMACAENDLIYWTCLVYIPEIYHHYPKPHAYALSQQQDFKMFPDFKASQ